MIWIDYAIDQAGENFKIKGEWEGEVMGIGPNGEQRDHWLYKPGDVFVVNENGWLIKTDQLNTLIMKYEEGKK